MNILGGGLSLLLGTVLCSTGSCGSSFFGGDAVRPHDGAMPTGTDERLVVVLSATDLSVSTTSCLCLFFASVFGRCMLALSSTSREART